MQLGTATQGRRRQRLVAGGLGIGMGELSFVERSVQLALLAVRNGQVVACLGHAPGERGLFERSDRDRVRRQRLRVPAPQVTDGPQVVGATTDARVVAVAAGGHHGLGEVVGCLVNSPGCEGDAPTRVERTRLDGRLPERARATEGVLDPLERLVRLAELDCRGAEQERQCRRVLIVRRLPPLEIPHDLAVPPGFGKFASLLDSAVGSFHASRPVVSRK